MFIQNKDEFENFFFLFNKMYGCFMNHLGAFMLSECYVSMHFLFKYFFYLLLYLTIFAFICFYNNLFLFIGSWSVTSECVSICVYGGVYNLYLNMSLTCFADYGYFSMWFAIYIECDFLSIV